MEKEIITMALEKLFELTHANELDYTSDSPEVYEIFKNHMWEVSQLVSNLRSTIKLLESVSK